MIKAFCTVLASSSNFGTGSSPGGLAKLPPFLPQCNIRKPQLKCKLKLGRELVFLVFSHASRWKLTLIPVLIYIHYFHVVRSSKEEQEQSVAKQTIEHNPASPREL